MIHDTTKGTDTLSFTYSFSPRETAVLAHFLRSHQDEIPDALADFSKAVENTVYNSLSLDEAERFYS
jgi:predicted transcriptional regulator